MFPIATRIVSLAIPTVAAAVFAYKRNRRNQKACAICKQVLLEESSSNHFSTTTTRQLGCGHLFHDLCIRAYVHSLRKCKLKCPDPNCEAPLTNEEREKFEEFKYNSFFCIICKKVLRQSYVPNYILSCEHQFCHKCLRVDFEIRSINSPETQWMCPLTDCKTPIDEQTVSKLKALEELNR